MSAQPVTTQLVCHTVEEVRALAREEYAKNPPPPLSDDQILKLRALLGRR